MCFEPVKVCPADIDQLVKTSAKPMTDCSKTQPSPWPLTKDKGLTMFLDKISCMHETSAGIPSTYSVAGGPQIRTAYLHLSRMGPFQPQSHDIKAVLGMIKSMVSDASTVSQMTSLLNRF